MSLVLVKGKVTWSVQDSTDDRGAPILIATNDTFKSVLWGYNLEDLLRCMNDSMQLLITYFFKRDRLSVLEDMGFHVERYTVLAPSSRSEREVDDPPVFPPVPVNGTTNFLQTAAAHA